MSPRCKGCRGRSMWCLVWKDLRRCFDSGAELGVKGLFTSPRYYTTTTNNTDLSRGFFCDIMDPFSCLHSLLPPPRCTAITSRLRSIQTLSWQVKNVRNCERTAKFSFYARRCELALKNNKAAEPTVLFVTRTRSTPAQNILRRITWSVARTYCIADVDVDVVAEIFENFVEVAGSGGTQEPSTTVSLITTTSQHIQIYEHHKLSTYIIILASYIVGPIN